MQNFEKWVEFYPAWDKRSTDRNKNFGIKSLELAFYLRGENGAVQFRASTDLYLPGSLGRPTARVHGGFGEGHIGETGDLGWMGIDLGFHSHVPQYEGQSDMGRPCEILGADTCYYDGSSLNGSRVLGVLVREGHEGVWRELEDYYNSIFEKEGDE